MNRFLLFEIVLLVLMINLCLYYRIDFKEFNILKYIFISMTMLFNILYLFSVFYLSNPYLLQLTHIVFFTNIMYWFILGIIYI